MFSQDECIFLCIFFQTTDKLESFLDVEKAIQEWGMLSCQRSARTRKQKKMFKRQFVKEELVMNVEIDWSHISTSNKTTWSKLPDGGVKSQQKNDEHATTDNVVICDDKIVKLSDVKDTDVNVLFETDFKNDIDVTQQYTLKVAKTTNSSCTTQIQHGVTKGVELSATLSVGGVLEVGSGFSYEEQLQKIEGETINRQVTWAAESNITVEPKKRATAQMQVIEKQQSADFTVLTTMAGYIIVKYISVNDSSLVFGHSAKIDTIIKDYIKEMKNRGKKFAGIAYPGDSKVQFQTKGSCTFKYGIKQVVSVVQDPAE